MHSDSLVDSLGTWRRSHYSGDLGSVPAGQEVTVFGMIASIRDQGKITFVILLDSQGLVQITIGNDDADEALQKKIGDLKEFSYIGVRGIPKKFPKAPGGIEIVPSQIKLLARPKTTPPFGLFSKQVPNLETRMDMRSIDLRRPAIQEIFRIRHDLLNNIRAYLSGKGYLEVTSPKIISSATEGGAALFPILYFDKEGFLAQSPQVYKEQLVGAFEKVYEIGPIFRAEESRTMRHLAETTSVDLEESFVTFEDVMSTLESLLVSAIKAVQKKRTLPKNSFSTEERFTKITYSDALKVLDKDGVHLEWGEDIAFTSLKTLEARIKSPYFITHWPTSTKAFYIKPLEDKPEMSESFDLICGSLELASGGTRIDSREFLERRLGEKGLNPRAFEYHLKSFDYAMPPHAGFGLGLDRLMMTLTGQENIREVVLFPRDQGRLTP